MRLDPNTETTDALTALAKKVDAIQHDVTAIRRAFFWQRVWGLIKVALVVIPLVWATARWLPTLRKAYTDMQDLIRNVEKILPN